MSHRSFAAVFLVALVLPVAAEDGLPATVVEAVKKASVFIKVEGEGWGASGSGFVVGGDDKALHVATNHHGDVTVESREGEGSTFSLRIPSSEG